MFFVPLLFENYGEVDFIRRCFLARPDIAAAVDIGERLVFAREQHQRLSVVGFRHRGLIGHAAIDNAAVVPQGWFKHRGNHGGGADQVNQLALARGGVGVHKL